MSQHSPSQGPYLKKAKSWQRYNRKVKKQEQRSAKQSEQVRTEESGENWEEIYNRGDAKAAEGICKAAREGSNGNA